MRVYLVFLRLLLLLFPPLLPTAASPYQNEHIVFTSEKIVFTSTRDGWEQLYVVNPDGSDLQNLSQNYAHEDDPNWSHDGTQIIFKSDRDTGSNFQIYLMNADGSNVRRISTNTFDDHQPDLSPDGTSIVFTRVVDGKLQVMRMDVTGQNVEQLTRDTSSPFGFPIVQGNFEPVWSPDGQLILFQRVSIAGPEQVSPDFRVIDLWVMNADGSNHHQLTHAKPGEGWGDSAWSKDGQLIVATFKGGKVEDRPNVQVYVMNADGSNPQNISRTTTKGTLNGDPSFSPDGTMICYEEVEGTRLGAIYVMNADGSNQHMIAGSAVGNNYHPRWGILTYTDAPPRWLIRGRDYE